MKKLTTILALSLLGASLGTAQAADLKEARTAAAAMNASWNYAFNHGDVRALTALYTPTRPCTAAPRSVSTSLR